MSFTFQDGNPPLQFFYLDQLGLASERLQQLRALVWRQIPLTDS
jgi:hypothetical protein